MPILSSLFADERGVSTSDAVEKTMFYHLKSILSYSLLFLNVL